MKIAFCWYFDKANSIFDNWRDGLRGALEILEKKHRIDWYLDKQLPPNPEWYDFILVWDDSNTDSINHLPKDVKKGLCLTTDPTNFQNLRQFDVVYCESEPVYEQVRREGIRAIRAFGTDTDFFAPKDVEKDIEYFYPATFSPWKKQSELAYLGNKLYCQGTMQPDGYDEYEPCLKAGVKIDIGYKPAEEIRDLYARTKKIIIPAVHGSERTVLETMSMNILPEVTNPKNIRTKSYIDEFKKSDCVNPREFVVKNYSAWGYAADLERGME
jgi:hypothetical protein